MRKVPNRCPMYSYRPFFKVRISTVIYVAALLFFLLFPSLTTASHLSNSEIDWLDRKGAVVFVSQTEYPPFEFINRDKAPDGMCIELVRWISTEFGFQVRFRNMTFKEAQQAVLNGDADVLTSLFYSAERDRIFDFTEMTWEVPALIFVASERPDITELRDLNGKRIAMQRGDYAAEFLKSNNIVYDLVPTGTFAEAVDMVVANKADAVIGDKQIVLYHLFSSKLTDKIKSVGEPLYIGQNCMGLKEGSTVLQSIMNKGMKLAHERGVFESITRKWTGTSYTPLKENWYQKHIGIILYVLGGLFVTILAVLFWNAQLRRAVSSKTAELRKSEDFLSTLIEALPNMIFVKDAKDLRYVRLNRTAEEIIGYSKKEFIGKSDYDMFPKDVADFFIGNDRKVLESRELVDIPAETLQTKNKGSRILHTKKVPIMDKDGTPLYLLGISEDITELRLSELKLREYAEIQSVLFREVNHRVKNNLIAIISMLHQEEDRAETEGDPKYLSRLSELVGRIEGLLTVHSLLSSSQWKPVPLSLLCNKVASGSIQALHPMKSVRMDVSPTEIVVDSDQAHYLSLVINELVTNSIKYGPNDLDVIVIRMDFDSSDAMIHLIYSDNGPGYPAEMLKGVYQSVSIGYNLIMGIVNTSLNGEIGFSNDGGAKAVITFPRSRETTPDLKKA